MKQEISRGVVLEHDKDDDIDCGAYDSSGLLRHAKAISSIRINILRAIYYLA